MEQEVMIPYKGKEPYIFISYAHKNSDAIFPIIAHLQENGYRVWYDGGIDPGVEWDENIALHINDCRYFIAFMSEAYLESSNCKDELNYARDKEKQRLLVYLEEIQLPEGMSMRLNRLQAIHKYKYKNEENFYEKLFEADGIKGCLCEPEISDNIEAGDNSEQQTYAYGSSDNFQTENKSGFHGASQANVSPVKQGAAAFSANNKGLIIGICAAAAVVIVLIISIIAIVSSNNKIDQAVNVQNTMPVEQITIAAEETTQTESAAAPESPAYLNGLEWGMSIDQVKAVQKGVYDDTYTDDNLALTILYYEDVPYNGGNYDVDLYFNSTGFIGIVYYFPEDSFDALCNEFTGTYGDPVVDGYYYEEKILKWTDNNGLDVILNKTSSQSCCLYTKNFDFITECSIQITSSPRYDYTQILNKLTWGMSYEEVVASDNRFKDRIDSTWTSDDEVFTYLYYKGAAFDNYSAVLMIGYNKNYGLILNGYWIYEDIFDELYNEEIESLGTPDEQNVGADTELKNAYWKKEDKTIYIYEDKTSNGTKCVYYGFKAPDSFYETNDQGFADPVMRNLKMGMTLEEVKKIEKGTIISEVTNENNGNPEITYGGETFRGHTADMVLSFDNNNRLDGITYYISEDLFREFYDEVYAQFGEPAEDNCDSDSNFTFAWWHTETNGYSHWVSYNKETGETGYGYWIYES